MEGDMKGGLKTAIGLIMLIAVFIMIMVAIMCSINRQGPVCVVADPLFMILNYTISIVP